MISEREREWAPSGKDFWLMSVVFLMKKDGHWGIYCSKFEICEYVRKLRIRFDIIRNIAKKFAFFQRNTDIFSFNLL